MLGNVNDGVSLAARLFLATLFLIFGWRKVRDYSGTVDQMVRDGVPAPALAAAGAIFMELPVAFAVAVGGLTRASALLMVIYTLATSLVEHRYWSMNGADKLTNLEQFYKNLSISGGFLLLFVAGPGKYSIDVLCGLAAP
jgi:putative oxidoreductase